ncbi:MULTISPECIES: alpha-galactosidase [Thermogemmatispora]|uniref:alpha-galactosidase n=1 Tax=Thermogemmatispora TaxID=768669 RepID=UPI000B2B5C79|nr:MULTISPECIES: alpha-galactosidase [Thermogemmatispora]
MTHVKITMMGAGSAVFARQLMTDVLFCEGLDEGTFALVDVDARRLELAHRIAEKLIERSGKRWRVEASTERRKVMAGSDFLINTIEVAGLDYVRQDYEIPLKYGIDQCIGDTIGPGGIFKALRTGPAWLAILRDAEELCPRAWVLNYTNPMSALTLAALRGTRLRTVGLCHSVQWTSRQLAHYLEVPYEELEWRCAGINHLAWFTELRWRGEDLYPRLRERARRPEVYELDPVRFETMLHFGAFVTESSGHFSEYVPYFRKRPELIARYCRAGYLGESGFYARNWPTWRREGEHAIEEMLTGERDIPWERSLEYGSQIIEAIVTGRPTVIYGNVRNVGLIENLPDGCVEVACLVDRNGVQPIHFGRLPEQLAALDRAHMAVHELLCEALLTGRREPARYALFLDPLSAAVCSLEELSQLFDELWEAERAALTAFT